MRAGPVLFLAALLPIFLTACQSEPDFDERYDKAAAEIADRAKAIDADIAEAEAARGQAEGKASGAGLPDPASTANPPPSSGE